MSIAEYLTTAELADITRVAPGTLAQWRKRRYGPEYVRIGGSVRYRRDVVERWLTEQEVRTLRPRTA